MNKAQQAAFERRFGAKKHVCVDGEEATFEWKDRYEVYSAACADEAERVSAMMTEVVRIIEDSAPKQLPISPENAEAWTDWATTVLKNIGVLRLWCEQNAPALKAYRGE